MTVEVLEHLGYRVVVPEQGCCGLAQQSNGLFEQATASVLALCDRLRSAGSDLPIISSSGSCTGMLKHEAREIMGVSSEALRDVGLRIRDTMEFLRELHEADALDTSFRRQDTTVVYHAPCQLKGQAMGLPAIDVLSLIPGVTIVESEVACCGMAGTYGLKKEKHAVAQAVGEPLFTLIRDASPELVLCDTETCRWQIREATGLPVASTRSRWCIAPTDCQQPGRAGRIRELPPARNRPGPAVRPPTLSPGPAGRSRPRSARWSCGPCRAHHCGTVWVGAAGAAPPSPCRQARRATRSFHAAPGHIR